MNQFWWQDMKIIKAIYDSAILNCIHYWFRVHSIITNEWLTNWKEENETHLRTILMCCARCLTICKWVHLKMIKCSSIVWYQSDSVIPFYTGGTLISVILSSHLSALSWRVWSNLVSVYKTKKRKNLNDIKIFLYQRVKMLIWFFKLK